MTSTFAIALRSDFGIPIFSAIDTHLETSDLTALIISIAFSSETLKYGATSRARSIDNALSVVDIFKLSPVPVGTGLIS